MIIFWIEFKYPLFLLLLLLIPVIIFLEIKKSKKWIKFIWNKLLNKTYSVINIWLYLEVLIKVIIFVCFILIIANPWYTNIRNEETRKWIDIWIILDISKSMLAEDIKPNRLESAKKVIWNFVMKVKDDRVSFTLFAWKPFVSIPLTFDYQSIYNFVKTISTDSITQEVPGLSWTAIWDSLIAWTDTLNNIKGDDKNREKVIVLLTDWEANVGIDPKIAIKYTLDKKIKVYTIWIWSASWTELFMTDMYGNKQFFIDSFWTPIKAKLDEEMLIYLANITWWKYYNAQSEDSLIKIFEELSKLNKTEIKSKIVKVFNSSYSILINLILINLILLLLLKTRYGIFKW